MTMLQINSAIELDRYIQEMVIWQVPQRVEGSQHYYKYRLFYGCSGYRIVGYDCVST